MSPTIRNSQPVTLDPRQAAALRALESRGYVLSEPYFSRAKFFAKKAGGGPFTYTLGSIGAPRTAFGYALGDDKTIAGFTAADGLATLCDTNLQNKQNTNGGESVVIAGLAIQLLPAGTHRDASDDVNRLRMADYRLAGAIFSTCSAQLSLNGGKNAVNMGIPTMIPGAGGLKGGAVDTVGRVALAGSPQSLPFASNGEAVRANYYAMPEGLTWKPQGQRDSQLVITLTPQRDIIIPSGGDADNNVTNVAANNAGPEAAVAGVATGTQGYTFPAEVMVELLIQLVGFVKGPSSNFM